MRQQINFKETLLFGGKVFFYLSTRKFEKNYASTPLPDPDRVLSVDRLPV